jgi:predicted ATP-grasp superfamily ATP-dependent carboligase
MRILLSEGASTSARQAITTLGLNGHTVEICDPDPHCLGRFSRFVRRFHRCPGLGVDPEGYFSFVCELLARQRFDVLLPIHEQGFLFAALRKHLPSDIGIALPSFQSYEQVHGKAEFSRLLSELDLPQPETRIVAGGRDVGDVVFPSVLKTSIGTASRGTWLLRAPSDLQQAIEELEASGSFDEPLVVQELAAGFVEHAQAVFSGGCLVGVHAYRQLSRGAGGGDARKESIHRPAVRGHLVDLGARLAWHGALSVDYIWNEERSTPLYIDCNPRLVEPMSAFIAGLDLAQMLVRISCGDVPPAAAPSREGVRTHIAMQALLGCALREPSRWKLLRECWRLLFKREPYAASSEELTPLRWDWMSVLPAIITAVWLLADPRAAHYLPRRGWGAHLLSPQSVRKIRSMVARPVPNATV